MYHKPLEAVIENENQNKDTHIPSRIVPGGRRHSNPDHRYHSALRDVSKAGLV
jgi:hypothetical protein